MQIGKKNKRKHREDVTELTLRHTLNVAPVKTFNFRDSNGKFHESWQHWGHVHYGSWVTVGNSGSGRLVLLLEWGL